MGTGFPVVELLNFKVFLYGNVKERSHVHAQT